MNTRHRIGPRMKDLMRILAVSYNGRCPSQAELYMRLTYRNGGSSNRYGSEVLDRCYRAGLCRGAERKPEDNTPGNAQPVEITEAGLLTV